MSLYQCPVAIFIPHSTMFVHSIKGSPFLKSNSLVSPNFKVKLVLTNITHWFSFKAVQLTVNFKIKVNWRPDLSPKFSI